MDVTIKDIAADAGVSVSTVSRVVNGSKSVSPELKGRVMAVLRNFIFVPMLQPAVWLPETPDW